MQLKKNIMSHVTALDGTMVYFQLYWSVTVRHSL